MRVLVTGGAGFIGSATARALLQRGDEVRVLDALTQPVHERGVRPSLDCELIEGDVRDASAWERALVGVDAVVHCAAYQDYLPDFSTFFSVNAAGTALLYETIVARNFDIARIVIASSQAVYGEGAARCGEHGVVVPDQRDPERLSNADWNVRCPHCDSLVEPIATPEELAEPRNAYGISKLAAETAGLALGAQYGIPSVALRYAIVHGAGQSPRNAYSGLLRSAAMNLLRGNPPVVFEDGAQLRDYVAIEDVVAANLLALDHADAPGRAYNVGGARSWTVLEVLAALNVIVEEPKVPKVPGLYRVGDVRHTIGDLTRLRALGWDAKTDLLETWRRYVDWLRTQPLGDDVVADATADMKARGVLRAATPGR